jgi:hypothetical protein
LASPGDDASQSYVNDDPTCRPKQRSDRKKLRKSAPDRVCAIVITPRIADSLTANFKSTIAGHIPAHARPRKSV